MKGKYPRPGKSQSQPSRPPIIGQKRDGEKELLHEQAECSIGTQLLTKPVSLEQTGQHSSQRKGEVNNGNQELQDQMPVQQADQEHISPILEEKTEQNEQFEVTAAGATFTLQTDQNEKIEALRPYQQLQSQEFKHLNTLEPNDKLIARMSVETETIGTGKLDRQDSRFKNQKEYPQQAINAVQKSTGTQSELQNASIRETPTANFKTVTVKRKRTQGHPNKVSSSQFHKEDTEVCETINSTRNMTGSLMPQKGNLRSSRPLRFKGKVPMQFSKEAYLSMSPRNEMEERQLLTNMKLLTDILMKDEGFENRGKSIYLPIPQHNFVQNPRARSTVAMAKVDSYQIKAGARQKSSKYQNRLSKMNQPWLQTVGIGAKMRQDLKKMQKAQTELARQITETEMEMDRRLDDLQSTGSVINETRDFNTQTEVKEYGQTDGFQQETAKLNHEPATETRPSDIQTGVTNLKLPIRVDQHLKSSSESTSNQGQSARGASEEFVLSRNVMVLEEPSSKTAGFDNNRETLLGQGQEHASLASDGSLVELPVSVNLNQRSSQALGTDSNSIAIFEGSTERRIQTAKQASAVTELTEVDSKDQEGNENAYKDSGTLRPNRRDRAGKITHAQENTRTNTATTTDALAGQAIFNNEYTVQQLLPSSSASMSRPTDQAQQINDLNGQSKETLYKQSEDQSSSTAARQILKLDSISKLEHQQKNRKSLAVNNVRDNIVTETVGTEPSKLDPISPHTIKSPYLKPSVNKQLLNSNADIREVTEPRDAKSSRMVSVRAAKKKSQRTQSGTHGTGVESKKHSVPPSEGRLEEHKNSATINANSKAIPLMKNNQSTSAYDTSNKYDQSIKHDTSNSYVQKTQPCPDTKNEGKFASNSLGTLGKSKVHSIPQVNQILGSFEQSHEEISIPNSGRSKKQLAIHGKESTINRSSVMESSDRNLQERALDTIGDLNAQMIINSGQLVSQPRISQDIPAKQADMFSLQPRITTAPADAGKREYFRRKTLGFLRSSANFPERNGVLSEKSSGRVQVSKQQLAITNTRESAPIMPQTALIKAQAIEQDRKPQSLMQSLSIIGSKQIKTRQDPDTKVFVLKFNDLRASNHVQAKGLSIIGKHLNSQSVETISSTGPRTSMQKPKHVRHQSGIIGNEHIAPNFPLSLSQKKHSISTQGALRLPLNKAVSLAAGSSTLLQRAENQANNPSQNEGESQKSRQTGGFIKKRRGSPGSLATGLSGAKRPVTQNALVREKGLPKNFILSSNSMGLPDSRSKKR